jgi:nicotinamide riboside transporter PnuC
VAKTLVAPVSVVPPVVAPPPPPRQRTGWLPPKAARLTPWDTGRTPQNMLGLIAAGATAVGASVPLQRLITRQSVLPLDLSVQFAALMLLALVSGGLGVWLLMRRNAGAWFMLLLSLLAAPALRATLVLSNGAGSSLDTALQWVAFQPLESGYSGFTFHNGGVELSQHGVLLIGLCLVTALVYAFGWWIWSTGLARIGRTPSHEWPWVGGLTAAVFVTVLAFGDLPSDVGGLIAVALALNLAATYLLARKYIEGWFFFIAAQVCHLAYALSVSDNHPRPPSMAGDGLVPATTGIATHMALYYWVTLVLGSAGLIFWVIDRRRANSLQQSWRR